MLVLTPWWVLIPILYAVQVLGLLSHPTVLLVYLLEQLSIHLFGTSPRASDSRILIFIVINAGFVAICTFVGLTKLQTIILLLALAFISSHNLLFSLGLKKPFRKENERMREQNLYADIVFKSKESNAGGRQADA